MDLIGLMPTEIEGRHFRRNIVSWHRMWDAIAEVYPDIFVHQSKLEFRWEFLL